MKPTSACVLVIDPHTGLVLVEVRPDGLLGLPGGKIEPVDGEVAAPYWCAARELREETGAELVRAASILVYEAGDHITEAFLATVVRNLPNQYQADVHSARWVKPAELVGDRGRFPLYCSLMFAELAVREVRPTVKARFR